MAKINFGQKMDEKTVQIKEIFDTLYLSEKQLTPGQADFVRSLKRQFKRDKSLSDRQLKILKEIRKYMKAENEPEVRYSRQLIADVKTLKNAL